MLTKDDILKLPLLEVINPPFVVAVLTKGEKFPWLDCFEKRRTTWMYKKFNAAFPNTTMTLREYLDSNVTRSSLVESFGESTAGHFVRLMEKLGIEVPLGGCKKGKTPSSSAQVIIESL
jgi:hypothetical protein